MSKRRRRRTFIDANGCPAELVRVDGVDVEVHYDDIPESDVTTIDGMRCTTPVRTLIDIAPVITVAELDGVIADMLSRGLASLDEIATRIGQPDMASRPGALLLKKKLFT